MAAGKDTACCKILLVFAVFVVFVATCFILARSFQAVDYHQYALLRQLSTGEIDRNTVFNADLVIKGPDYDMVHYDATAHNVRLDKLQIATFDRVGIELSVAFQYFLRKTDLVALHDQYRTGYKDIIIDRVTDALKAKAPSFSVRQYINDRKLIEEELFLVMRQRLEGQCCYQSCRQKGTCLAGCIVSEFCPLAKRGMFVEVRYFQLLWVSITYEIGERYLQALILQEQAESSELKQQAVVIRKETEVLMQEIRNKAKVISNNATSHGNAIVRQARAERDAILENAGQAGLRDLYDKLNIATEEQRNSFDYLRTLRREPHCHVTVDFQQRTIGSWTKT